MSTTNLVVELVIVGVGTAVWVFLLLLAAFGHEWVPVDQFFSPSAAVPLLALVYLLGIVTDRVSDNLLGPLWAKDNRARTYGQDGQSYAADKMLVMSEPRFAQFYEYNKSRQRICRSWTLNALLILLSLNVLIWLHYGLTSITLRVAALGSLFLLLLACGCWFSGQRLNAVQYRKVKEQAALIRARQKAPVSNKAGCQG